MRTPIHVAVFLLVWCQLSGAVVVREGDFHFTLDSVKALGALVTGGDEGPLKDEQQLAEAKAVALCSHPDLPEDFKPLCLRRDAGPSMARLVLLASHPDACEICQSVACTGC